MRDANYFREKRRQGFMKSNRFLALILSFCLAAALALPVGAAPAPPCGCGEVLQVFVRGFLRALYFDYGTPKQREAFLPLHLLMDDQGNSRLPITKTWVIDHDHLEDPEYEFLYDYRLDAFEQARQLDEFIETLCDETGHDKIALSGMSQGTSVVMTYMAVYGKTRARVETLILINGSYQGDVMLPELMTNRLALSAPATINFIESLLPSSPISAAFFNLWRLLPGAGLKTPASGDVFAPLNAVYNWAITRLLGQMPAIWTFLPESYRDDALKLLEGAKYAYLRERAGKYYAEVQSQVPFLLDEAIGDGIKVAVIAAYGKAPIPLTENAFYQGDLIIDTANESGGATVAAYGGTLPTPADTTYFSSDAVIDASTCNLPDKTWFIKGNGHDFMPSEALRQWIIHYSGTPDIWANAEFPQFLRLTEDGGTQPLTEGPAPAAPQTLADAFAGLLKAFGL
jgi:pimeloyl-ACP methyl ester carboxylesterase